MAESDSSFSAFATRMTAWRLSDLDRELIRAQFDRSPDAVHDLRVAARRLQYTLDCFRSLLDSPELRRLRKRVKAILAAGRTVRDRDIALELAAKSGLGPDSMLEKTFKNQREAAAEALHSLVERPRYYGFEERWAERLGLAEGKSLASQAPPRPVVSKGTQYPDWDAAESCLTNARRGLPSLVSRLLALGRATCAEEPTPGELHRLRLAGKRLRYTLELFRGFYGAGLEELLRILKTAQKVLGEISDCDATEALVRCEGLDNTADGAELLRWIKEDRSIKVTTFLLMWRNIIARPDLEEVWTRALGSGPVQGAGHIR